jgi:hypothetical protein
MPISAAQFAIVSLDELTQIQCQAIIEFAKASADFGYSSDELKIELGLGSEDASCSSFEEALEALVHIGCLDTSIVRGTEYYRFAEDFREIPATQAIA